MEVEANSEVVEETEAEAVHPVVADSSRCQCVVDRQATVVAEEVDVAVVGLALALAAFICTLVLEYP